MSHDIASYLVATDYTKSVNKKSMVISKIRSVYSVKMKWSRKLNEHHELYYEHI